MPIDLPPVDHGGKLVKTTRGLPLDAKTQALLSNLPTRHRYIPLKVAPPPRESETIPTVEHFPRTGLITPSLKGIDFDFRNVCHNYSESPAIVTGYFEDGKRIAVYINSEQEKIFAVITRSNRTPVSSKAQAANFFNAPVNILPPIGPLARRERLLAADYVNSSLNTNLAPIHFRNQLYLLSEIYYEDFVRLAEESWEHLQIRNFEAGSPEEDLCLFVRDGPFVAEVAWVGHGLQAWLQTIWFLARTPRESTIILDEPDVYLHADLQRKLIPAC